jgi:hypothetical protein
MFGFADFARALKLLPWASGDLAFAWCHRRDAEF